MASVITVAFEIWKAQEAASGKAVLLDEFVFANVPNLDPTQPIDRNEKLPPANQIVHRQAVNKAGLASENAVAYSVTMGADVGNFDFNWIGLLNKASGTIAMITHAPTQKKLKNQNGQQGNVLTRSFLLEFNGAAAETQIKTTAETWQIDFTARLSGIDEMQRLINVDSYGEAAFFGDGFEVIRSGEQFTVKKGLGYVGGLRGELAQNQILNGLRNTKIYADFSYQGNIVSQWNTAIKITAAATLNNYVDTAGFTHQVFAIASIDASGNVKDLRPIGGLSDQGIDSLRKQIKSDLNGKVDKANITHQKGNSTELVASQQLVTTEVEKHASKDELKNTTSQTIFARAEAIPLNADLNNYIKPGLFFQAASNPGANAQNYPAMTAGALEVVPTGNTSVKQVFTDWYDKKTYTRRYNGGNKTWADKWDEHFTKLNPPTAAELGVYSTQQADDKFQPKGNYQPAGNYQPKGDYVDKTATYEQVVKGPLTANSAMYITSDGVGSDLLSLVTWGGKFGLRKRVNGNYGGTVEVPMTGGTIALIEQSLGFGQTWKNLLGSRSVGVTYTNASAKPILVAVTGQSINDSTDNITVDGVIVAKIGGMKNYNIYRGISFIVPPGSKYVVGKDIEVAAWSELS
ncbi:phage tail-collar fiber domain-containing protein [Providencia hangzhouensis]|uniref:phage tail-collar fiber domain-containing protein n=1 Tax=Providencia hangzhouensis TaxID=3031799 RepID=UPI0034DD2C56